MSDIVTVDFDILTLSDFHTWSDDSLRCYLALRSKSVTGSSAELAARAFVCWEEKIPVNESQEHKMRVNLEAYKKKMIINGCVLPDLFGLKEGWLEETDANRSLWPAIFITDIADYLKLRSATDLVTRLCNEYKQGKAYRYFAAGWVQPVHYHPLHETSSICFICCNVMPSMAVRNKAYRTWAAVEKSTPVSCGGRIFEAYCTCPAGLQGSCNHIAGLLFRVEYAVRTGLVNLSSTSQRCKWNLPSTKISFTEPRVVSELEWTKVSYSKPADNSQKKRVTKQLFSPVSVSSESYLTNSEKVTADLASLLLTAVPDSCFVQLYTAKPFPKKSPQHLPETVTDVFARLPCTSFEEKLAALSVTDVDITALCEATVSQRDSDVWVQQRVGRITATNCHAVFTRMATVANKPDVNCNRLLNEVLGLTKKCQTAAMKHGIAMEPHAARQYSAVMKMKHAKFRTYKAGLILCKSDPYLAASPDLFVNCECHSRGLCEIKSPYKTRHLVPAHTHIKYLENVGGHSKLTRNSDYYFQVQAQMGVTGLKYCDFFVYTMHGYHLERIEFDEELWDVIRSRSLQFWRYYVVPKIEQSVLIMPVNEPSVTSETDTADSDISDNEATDVVDHGYCKPPVKKLRACPLKLPPYPPVCLCGVCHATCISDDAHFSADSIQCSGCLLWFHHTCVNVMSADDTWLCDICITEQY